MNWKFSIILFISLFTFSTLNPLFGCECDEENKDFESHRVQFLNKCECNCQSIEISSLKKGVLDFSKKEISQISFSTEFNGDGGAEFSFSLLDSNSIPLIEFKKSTNQQHEFEICDVNCSVLKNVLQLKSKFVLSFNQNLEYSLRINEITHFGTLENQEFESLEIQSKSISNLKICSSSSKFQQSIQNFEKRQGSSSSCTPSFRGLQGEASSGDVYAISIYKQNLYVAGNFQLIGGIAANNIARYNGSAWFPLGTGCNVFVNVLTVFQDLLYVGGAFTQAGGRNTTFLAIWNGSSWNTSSIVLGNWNAGSGINSMLVIGSDIIFAGWFSFNFGANYHGMTRWDGSNFYSLGTYIGTTNNAVTSLASIGKDIYAAGYFTIAGGLSVNRIARCNGTDWFSLGTGVAVAILSLAPVGSNLYAGGYFTNAGGVAANYIAQWNGTAWSAMGSGLNSAALQLISIGTDLYVGGQFTTAGSISAGRIAKWNGTVWSSVSNFGSGMNNSVNAFYFDNSTNDLYMGGVFGSVNGSLFNKIVNYGGCLPPTPQPTPIPTPQPTPQPTPACSPSFSGFGDSNVGSIYAIYFYNNNMYVGGDFTRIGGIYANNIARWDGSNWFALGNSTHNGTNDSVFSFQAFNSFLYVGGQFTLVNGGTLAATLIARWNGTNWFNVANFIQYGTQVYAMKVYGNAIFVGGWFNIDGYENQAFVRWDGVEWFSLGANLNSNVFAIEIIGDFFYLGGAFTSVGSNTSIKYATKWDINTYNYYPLGSTGLNGPVYALTSIGNEIYAGGAFNVADGLTANRVARFNGTNWFVMGSGGGFNNVVYALSATANKTIFAGGEFQTVDGISAERIAKWDGFSWSSVGAGNSVSNVLTLKSSGNDTFIGGTFTSIASGTIGTGKIVKYNCVIPPPTPAPTPMPTPSPTPVPTPLATASTSDSTTSQPTQSNSTDSTIQTTSQISGNSIVSSSTDSGSTSIIIGVVIGVLVLLICIVIVVIFLVLKKKRNNKNANSTTTANKESDVALEEKGTIVKGGENGVYDDKSTYSPLSGQQPQPTPQYVSTSAVLGNSNSGQYKSSPSENITLNNSQYVSSAAILENSTTKLEANELFKKFAIPYSDLKLDKQVGKGNFGSVYLAHRISAPNQQIACKQIAAKPASDTYASTASAALKKETRAFKDFIAEAKVLQSIPPSPYVVGFIGLCSEPFCILTEFVDGGSLLEYLNDARCQLTFNIAIGFLKQICKGIAHLHKNGIIHRDLAARNVLLRNSIDEETGVRQCVLVDMGLARLFDTGENYLKTKSQIPLKWTAPEALREKKFSEKSDIYSFGIMSIECFTRTTPFPKMTALECAMAISSGRLIPSVKGICPDEFVPTFDSCFALKPEQRPTASQLIVSFDSLKH